MALIAFIINILIINYKRMKKTRRGSVSFLKRKENMAKNVHQVANMFGVACFAYVMVFAFSIIGMASAANEILMRATNDMKVYEIDSQGNKHWLNMTAADFLKTGLSFDKVQVVTPAELETHKTADDIVAGVAPGTSMERAAGDSRVYEIDNQGNRHWLNMTAQDFIKSGRSFDLVRTVTQAELETHNTASDVVPVEPMPTLIRATGDSRVYEIDNQGNRHWLNMTAQDFIKSGRSFDQVQTVTPTELETHSSSNDILPDSQQSQSGGSGQSSDHQTQSQGGGSQSPDSGSSGGSGSSGSGSSDTGGSGQSY